MQEVQTNNNMADETNVIQVSASPELKQMFVSLYLYLSRRLGLKEPPSKVTLTKSKENSDNPWGLTGYYDHTTKTIRIYVTDRHNIDILRSFAHEVIHHWQNERGTLHPEEKTNKEFPVNNDTDPHYAQINPWLRKREMEAFMFGNLIFRDWQDENRYGSPPTPPVLPSPYD